MTEDATTTDEAGPPTPTPSGRRAVGLVGVLGFVVRAGYDLFVHPPFDWLYSDMSTYAARAQRLVDQPWTPTPSATFYPYGTHYLVAVGRLLGGPRPDLGVAVLYAALGALAAWFFHLAARELFPERPRLSLALGLVFALHPVWIALGGFVLSETPFTACLAASTYFVLRLARSDPRRPALTALGLGVSFAVGMTVRPQLLFSLPFLLIACARRPRPRALPLGGWAALAAPLVLVASFSAARMRFHTGELGFISKNGAFNFAFGRCHARQIFATKPKESYQPPSFRALALYEQKHGVKPIPELDPALGEELTLPGAVWDERAARDLAKRCVAATGPARQVKYSLTHVLLLFAYTVAFPLKGALAIVSSVVTTVLVAPAYLLGLVRAFRRRDLGERVLVAHLFGLTVTAMIFFGEVRLRVPYDGILILLTALYATRAVDWFRTRRAPPRAPDDGGSPVEPPTVAA